MFHNLCSPFTQKQQELLKVQLSKIVREGNGGNIEYVTDIVKLFSKFLFLNIHFSSWNREI